MSLTPNQIRNFDEASNHAFECKCDLCVAWWLAVGLEQDECTHFDDYPICGEDHEGEVPFTCETGDGV